MDAQPTDTPIDQWIYAWCAVTQRARQWQTWLDEALAPHHLAAPQLLILWRAAQALPPGISQVDLARQLSISTAGVSGIVETLRARGWLETMRPPADRRRLHCGLTPLGEASLRKIMRDLTPLADRCLRDEQAHAPVALLLREDAA